MPAERKCKRCGRLLVAAATALCATCMALPPSSVAPEKHATVISLAYIDHAEPPHMPEDQLVALHERGDQALRATCQGAAVHAAADSAG